jgi:hypothetical protein
MRRLAWVFVAVGALAAAGAVGFRVYRGPVGESAALGGDLPATAAPEFGSLDASRWAIAEPKSLASMKGEVVFVEGWSPG